MSSDPPALQRLALVLEYSGQHLCGWQRQANGPSVQACLELALEKIEGHATPSTVAGRTDSGVHAEAQLVHVDIDLHRARRSINAYIHGLNMLLPEQIRVLTAQPVRADFHARFDCMERAYRYSIWNRTTSPAINCWRHWWIPRPLDTDAMQTAANILTGRHDFSSFRASGCQASSSQREIRQLQVDQNAWSIEICIRADGFLYHMVRNIVGTLAEVGRGKRQPESMIALIKARDRRLAAETAPAHGLYFTDAVYPEFGSADLTRFRSGVV